MFHYTYQILQVSIIYHTFDSVLLSYDWLNNLINGKYTNMA